MKVIVEFNSTYITETMEVAADNLEEAGFALYQRGGVVSLKNKGVFIPFHYIKYIKAA